MGMNIVDKIGSIGNFELIFMSSIPVVTYLVGFFITGPQIFSFSFEGETGNDVEVILDNSFDHEIKNSIDVGKAIEDKKKLNFKESDVKLKSVSEIKTDLEKIPVFDAKNEDKVNANDTSVAIAKVNSEKKDTVIIIKKEYTRKTKKKNIRKKEVVREVVNEDPYKSFDWGNIKENLISHNNIHQMLSKKGEKVMLKIMMRFLIIMKGPFCIPKH